MYIVVSFWLVLSSLESKSEIQSSHKKNQCVSVGKWQYYDFNKSISDRSIAGMSILV